MRLEYRYTGTLFEGLAVVAAEVVARDLGNAVVAVKDG